MKRWLTEIVGVERWVLWLLMFSAVCNLLAFAIEYYSKT